VWGPQLACHATHTGRRVQRDDRSVRPDARGCPVQLVCAPTGAGKTNVALLTVLRELGRVLAERGGGGGGGGARGGFAEPFKIVYLAPVRAVTFWVGSVA
jgi:Lhr-like helicase